MNHCVCFQWFCFNFWFGFAMLFCLCDMPGYQTTLNSQYCTQGKCPLAPIVMGSLTQSFSRFVGGSRLVGGSRKLTQWRNQRCKMPASPSLSSLSGLLAFRPSLLSDSFSSTPFHSSTPCLSSTPVPDYAGPDSSNCLASGPLCLLLCSWMCGWMCE